MRPSGRGAGPERPSPEGPASHHDHAARLAGRQETNGPWAPRWRSGRSTPTRCADGDVVPIQSTAIDDDFMDVDVYYIEDRIGGRSRSKWRAIRRCDTSSHPMPLPSVSAQPCRRTRRPVVTQVGLVGARGVAPAWPTCGSDRDSCSRTSDSSGSDVAAGRAEGRLMAEPAADPAAARGPAGVHPGGLGGGRGLRARHQRDDGPTTSLGAVSADRVRERGAGGVSARKDRRGIW